jgi:uncharacterized membrane protein YbaN (DUF454 family)
MACAVYRGLGIGLVVLAAIGAFLPLLPSTPFLLLATGCFTRSSPQWNERLLRSPLLGRTLRDWHTNRVVRPKTKAIALGSMLLVGSATLIGGSYSWMIDAMLLISMSFGAIAVMRLPSGDRIRTRDEFMGVPAK